MSAEFLIAAAILATAVLFVGIGVWLWLRTRSDDAHTGRRPRGDW